MLDYIKANVSKQCDENKADADTIRHLLNSYEDRLKELDMALKEAAALLNNTNAKNGLNAQALGDLQVLTHQQLIICDKTWARWLMVCIIVHFGFKDMGVYNIEALLHIKA